MDYPAPSGEARRTYDGAIPCMRAHPALATPFHYSEGRVSIAFVQHSSPLINMGPKLKRTGTFAIEIGRAHV